MINGLDIYFSKNVGRGLKPVGTNKKQIANGSKGRGCIKGKGLKILQ